jgi:hypothetical protein
MLHGFGRGTRRSLRTYVFLLHHQPPHLFSLLSFPLIPTNKPIEMPPTATKPTPPINVKLLLIGNSSVGKSSILLRFSDEQWLPEDESSATIGVDFRVHKMDVKGKKVKLSIWVRVPVFSRLDTLDL